MDRSIVQEQDVLRVQQRAGLIFQNQRLKVSASWYPQEGEGGKPPSKRAAISEVRDRVWPVRNPWTSCPHHARP